MAPRLLLAELSEQIARTHGISVSFEWGGGIDVARRVRAGADGDVLVLADEVMAQLSTEEHVVPGSVRPLFVSEVVAAVPDGASVPAIDTEDDLRAAILDAPRIAYSTGPSGDGLLALIGRWRLDEAVRPRLVQASPGVSVGTFLAEGRADLAFQQRSEVAGVPGAHVVGALPGEAAITTVFGGGVLARSEQPDQAAEVIEILASEQVADVVAAHGLTVA